MKLPTAQTLLALAACLAVLGCSQQAAEAPEGPGTALEVEWFEGTPDEAFALARQVGKPLFLYWGAEWCPPCHYLKDKIFSQPDFVERSRRFVAVYLDGDEPHAQVLGEQLDVQGYPTVMVYSAEGEELLRMPSDVDVTRYAEMMDRAFTLDRPVREVLVSVLEQGPAAADRRDLDVLAYYSWGQDSQIDLPAEERLPTFRRLWRETPPEQRTVRHRFLGLVLGEAARLARGSGEGAPPVLDEGERRELAEAQLDLLASEEASRDNLFDVTYGAADAIELLAPTGELREPLKRTWETAARRFEDDERLSTDDRLTASLTLLELAALDAEAEAPVPAELAAHVDGRVDWAMTEVADGSELQAVLNTALFLLGRIGLEAKAEALLTDRLEEATAPYYFISALAGLKRRAGSVEEAISLYRKAWESATGRYTRFRWGATYLRRLMELAPDRTAAIEADSLTILDELLTHDDAFALGNWLRLGQLERAYGEWNEDGGDATVVDAIRARIQGACERYPAEGDDSQRERCASFLAAA